MWKIYKEGQGKWGRGCLMFVVGVVALYAVQVVGATLPEKEAWGGWFDYRWLIQGPLLLAAVAFGVWLFNHRKAVDFLIDTESELKNKVTWPTRQEEINASVVVVVTVVIMMFYIVFWDAIFFFGRSLIYPGS